MDTDITVHSEELSGRLVALRSYGILDTPREIDFDELVELAAKICAAPISVVNLIDEDRQWFKAEVGLDIRETHLDVSICRHVLLQPGVTVIPDLRDDPRVCRNPLVTEDAGLRFYAGCLLQSPEGHGLGTLCVLDRVPRELTADQLAALRILASQVVAQMELRRSIAQKSRLLEQQKALLAQREMMLREVNHRTKNNLQLIIGLINLQIRKVDDKEARMALSDTARRIMSIAAVHEKLYQSDQVDSIDVAVYLAGVVKGIQATAPASSSIQLDIDTVHLPMDIAIPMALAVNEMVTNALKYAYKGAPGCIRISLKPIGELLRLSVSDDGKGLPEGFAVAKSKSLGIKIISSLAKQINGTLRFVDNRPGVQCQITFNAAPLARLQP